MAERWTNDAGTRRQIIGIYVNDAGSARRIQEQWVNDAGTLRRVFLGDIIDIEITNASRSVASPSTATAIYSLLSTGDISTTLLGSGAADRGDWISPKIGMASYECRATLLTGSLTSGTMGAWLSLSATRSWTLNAAPGAGALSATFTLEIRRVSDALVMDTATISISAESS